MSIFATVPARNRACVFSRKSDAYPLLSSRSSRWRSATRSASYACAVCDATCWRSWISVNSAALTADRATARRLPIFPGNGTVTPTPWSLPAPEVGSNARLCPTTSALKVGSGNAAAITTCARASSICSCAASRAGLRARASSIACCRVTRSESEPPASARTTTWPRADVARHISRSRAMKPWILSGPVMGQKPPEAISSREACASRRKHRNAFVRLETGAGSVRGARVCRASGRSGRRTPRRPGGREAGPGRRERRREPTGRRARRRRRSVRVRAWAARRLDRPERRWTCREKTPRPRADAHRLPEEGPARRTERSACGSSPARTPFYAGDLRRLHGTRIAVLLYSHMVLYCARAVRPPETSREKGT